MSSAVATPLPEGLAELAPGPALSAALATVDRARCSTRDLYELLAARARQVAFEQAQLLADLLEVARAVPDAPKDRVERRAEPDQEFGADEAAFTLSWSRQAAQAHLEVARNLMVRLPEVYAALCAGHIDLVRARVFVEALAPLADDLAAEVAGRLLGPAGTLTPGQLRNRLRYHAAKADPESVRRRYQASVAARRVYTNLRDDGTAEVSATGLPPDRAAAAFDRIDRLARAAKAAGDQRGLQQLRADAYLDVLSGRPFQMEPSRDAAAAATDRVHATVGDDPAGEASRLCACGGPQPAPRQGVVEIQVKLSTLACLNDDPGIIPGWGPVVADVARQVAAEQEARWRCAVTNDQGDPLYSVPVRRRPTAAVGAMVRARDRTCRAPGCRRRAQACDLDHNREYRRGGSADAENLCTLCRLHHRLRHEQGHRTHHLGGAAHLWESPTGRLYLVTSAGEVVLTAEDRPRHTLDDLDIDVWPPPGLVGAFADDEDVAA